ncbi:MAG TPA: CehA/McbA family metallohydrolase [Anaerolineaceae bacterium]
MTPETITIEGEFTREQEKIYLDLPFDVPEGFNRLEVELGYSDRIGSEPFLEGGNTIDLGIFDERGSQFLTSGFRGWSGSERLQIAIGEDEATPGYLAGPINPGRWAIHLGLYKIGPQGCHYRIKIKLSEVVQSPARSSSQNSGTDLPTSQPTAPFAPWLRGELHVHTQHSDGELSVEAILGLARQKGLDFIALTDHNTISSQLALSKCSDPGLILLRGVEVTTFKGHFNVWGIRDWIDFRIQRPDDLKSALQRAADLGGLVSCNHPKPYGPAWDYPEITQFDCLEVWNGPWEVINDIALEYWLSLLASGRRITAVGGSDYHRAGELWGEAERQLGSPANWVYVPGEINAKSILQSIRDGHVCLSDKPSGPLLSIAAGDKQAYLPGDCVRLDPNGSLTLRASCQGGDGGHLRVLDQNGLVYEQAVNDPVFTRDISLKALDSLYVRAELRAPDGHMRALTNPIYLAK